MAVALQLAFGERVRRERERLGVSQEKLGELAGLHRTYIGHIERGDVEAADRILTEILQSVPVPVIRDVPR